MVQHKTFCKYCKKSVARYDKHKKGKIHLIKRRCTPITLRPIAALKKSSKSDFIWETVRRTRKPIHKASTIEVDYNDNKEVYYVRIESADLLHSTFKFDCLQAKWQFSVTSIDEELYFDIVTDRDLLVNMKVSLCSLSNTISTSRILQLSTSINERWTELNTIGDDFTVLKLVVSAVSPDPHPPTSERIKCPAEARLIMKWAQDHNITQKALNDMFTMFNLPTFNMNNMPKSVYFMTKMARVATPDLTLYSATDRNGIRFYYYKPEDILRVMLSSSNITEGWCYHYKEEGSISHQSNSLLWEYLQHELQPLIDDGCLLLLPQFFYDDFNLSRFSSVVTDDLLMNVANCSVDVQLNREFKYLCCSMQANKWDIISTVLMPFQHMLERGEYEAYFAPERRNRRFCGSIFSLIGDYIGHSEMLGLIGPKASFPSRFTERSQDQLTDPALLTFRDADKTFAFLNKVMVTGSKRGYKVHNQEQLRSKGFRDCFEMSPLWDSTLLRYKLFQRLAPCLLHSEILGNLLRHVNFVGQLLGNERIEIKEVNQRLTAIKKWPGTTAIPGIYEVTKSRKTGVEKIKVKWSTGPKLDSFYQVATAVLRGLLDDDRLTLLAQHIDLTQVLHQPIWSQQDIDKLQSNIETIKQSLLKLYPAPDFKWKTVKFEALSAWPSFIKLMAPPYLLSTQTWEVVHQEGRRIYNLTNKQLTARDYLKKTVERKLIKHHQHYSESDTRYNNLTVQLTHVKRQNEDYRPIGKIHVDLLPSIVLSKCNTVLQQLRQKKLVSYKVWTATGFYFKDSILRVEDSVSFNSPLCDGVTFGTIANIYVIQAQSSNIQRLWVQLKTYEVDEKPDPASNYLLKESRTVLVLFGYEAFEVERREHVVADFANPGRYVLNTFCRTPSSGREK